MELIDGDVLVTVHLPYHRITVQECEREYSVQTEGQPVVRDGLADVVIVHVMDEVDELGVVFADGLHQQIVSDRFVVPGGLREVAIQCGFSTLQLFQCLQRLRTRISLGYVAISKFLEYRLGIAVQLPVAVDTEPSVQSGYDTFGHQPVDDFHDLFVIGREDYCDVPVVSTVVL